MLRLTMKEVHRFKVISETIECHLKVKKSANVLKLSERQIYRIKASVKKEGAKGKAPERHNEQCARRKRKTDSPLLTEKTKTKKEKEGQTEWV